MIVEKVSFKYEKQNILNQINFQVKEKEMLGISKTNYTITK